MITIILLAVLNLRHPLLHVKNAQPPPPKCSIHVIGFRFEGVEGQRFELSGVTYTVGKSGFVELISSGESRYKYEGKTLPLTVWPANQFSFLQVPLPKPKP